MKTRTQNLIVALALLAFLTLNIQPSTVFAQGTAFTYQGQLQNNGALASGTYNLTFSLFNTNTGGVAIAEPVTNSAVAVSNGLFTVAIDFGAAVWNGATNWLQIGVETNGGGNFTTLTPRQQLTPIPYAIYAEGANAAGISGTLPAGDFSGTYSNAVNFSNASNSFNGGFSGNGAGLTNVSAQTFNGLASSNFWQTTGNSGTSPTNGNFVGTADNQPVEIRVGGLRGWRVEPDPRGLQAANLIGGYISNAVQQPGSGGDFIGGGGGAFSGVNIIHSNSSGVFIGAGSTNQIGPNVNDAVIGGGYGNTIQSVDSVVVGGSYNTVQSIAPYSVVGGGYENLIQSNGYANVIAGGVQNSIATNADRSFIGGGQGNSIAADTFFETYGVIGGGANNTIQASSGESFVGGGSGNSIQSSAYFSTISGGVGNTITTNSSQATVGGGYDNVVNSIWSTIGGGRGNAINSYASTIPGGWYNTIGSLTPYATIGGGGYNNNSGFYGTIGGGISNSVYAYYGAICGGEENDVYGQGATVAGGFQNTASGNDATVAGGDYNTASGTGSFIGGGGFDGVDSQGNVISGPAAVIGGGLGNNIPSGGLYSFIGAGYENTASGEAATVAGGDYNKASGTGSFIGGGGFDGVNSQGNVISGNAAVIGGGLGNNIPSGGAYSFIGGGYVNGIQGNAPYSMIGGGLFNQIYGDTNDYGTSVIAGGYAGTINSNSWNSFIGGGGANTIGTNSDHSVIVGGNSNAVLSQAEYGTIGGGVQNTVGAYASSIDGGSGNLIQGNSSYSFIGGGQANLVSGLYGTVGGGIQNSASGSYSTVPGGVNNNASGARSFAAGDGALAAYYGSFVWADASGGFFSSTASNQFNVRAMGGVRLVTGGTGMTLDGQGVVPSGNYVFAYSTMAQNVTSPLTFQNATFSNDAQLNGWSHAAGSSQYLCAQTGLYLVQYTAEAYIADSMSMRGTVNSIEVSGSQAYASPNNFGPTVVISKSFLASVNSGSFLTIQFTGNSGSDSLQGGGSGSVPPTISLTITRIQ